MSKSSSQSARVSPTPTTAQHSPTQLKENGVAKPVEVSETLAPNVHKYFRIRRISNYLHEIVEVEIDEAVAKTRVISKQDLREILMVKLESFIYDESQRTRK